MRLMLPVLFAASALITVLSTSNAARDLISAPSSADAELIVIEVEGCLYCKVFRRDVLPGYLASPRSKEAPIRFVDYNTQTAADLPLHGPVTIVPTFVMIKDNREVGRLPGYVGRSEFLRAVTHMLSAP